MLLQPQLYNLYFKKIYNIFERFHSEGITKESFCQHCKQVNSLWYRLVKCTNQNIIWSKYIQIVEQITSDQCQINNIKYLFDISNSKFFPKTIRKLLVWFTTQKLLMSTTERADIGITEYFNQIHLRFLNIKPEKMKILCQLYHSVCINAVFLSLFCCDFDAGIGCSLLVYVPPSFLL